MNTWERIVKPSLKSKRLKYSQCYINTLVTASNMISYCAINKQKVSSVNPPKNLIHYFRLVRTMFMAVFSFDFYSVGKAYILSIYVAWIKSINNTISNTSRNSTIIFSMHSEGKPFCMVLSFTWKARVSDWIYNVSLDERTKKQVNRKWSMVSGKSGNKEKRQLKQTDNSYSRIVAAWPWVTDQLYTFDHKSLHSIS